MYVNDVQAVVNGAHLQLYADDTVLVASGNDREEAAGLLQPALDQYSLWCRANKLSLKGNRAICLCASTPRSLSLWQVAWQWL